MYGKQTQPRRLAVKLNSAHVEVRFRKLSAGKGPIRNAGCRNGTITNSSA